MHEAYDINDVDFLKKIIPGEIMPRGCISIPRSTDRNGSPLVIIYGRYLSALAFMVPEDLLAACIYLANIIIEQQPACMRYGCTLLVDLQGTPWAIQQQLVINTDLSDKDINDVVEESEVLQESIKLMINFFKYYFPIKWNNILLFKPWWWLKWKNIDKAILLFSEEELWQYISLRQLPLDFGGSLIIDKALFLRDLLAKAQKNKEEISWLTVTNRIQKEKTKQTLTQSLQLQQQNLSNPWNIVQLVIPSIQSGKRCKLSKTYSNCTLDQIKKFMLKDLKFAKNST